MGVSRAGTYCLKLGCVSFFSFHLFSNVSTYLTDCSCGNERMLAHYHSLVLTAAPHISL